MNDEMTIVEEKRAEAGKWYFRGDGDGNDKIMVSDAVLRMTENLLVSFNTLREENGSVDSDKRVARGEFVDNVNTFHIPVPCRLISVLVAFCNIYDLPDAKTDVGCIEVEKERELVREMTAQDMMGCYETAVNLRLKSFTGFFLRCQLYMDNKEETSRPSTPAASIHSENTDDVYSRGKKKIRK